MSDKMDIWQAVIIFLAAALVVMVGATVYLSYKCNAAREIAEEREWQYSLMREEKEQILQDYIKVYNDNEKLSAALSEIQAINKELMNAEKVKIEEAEREDNPATADEANLLPTGHTNTFRCEDFHLFHPNSDQYKLQEGCTTDITTGIRILSVFKGTNKYDQYYCAALAGAYGTEIGRTYKVKLKCGTEFKVILADFKHPIDNIRDDDYGDSDTNYDGEPCTNVIEFVVDMDSVLDKVKQAGTMSALAQFGGLYGDGGDIISIEYLGKVW